MTPGEVRFLQELNQVLGTHPEKDQIIAEYKSHIYEVLREELTEESNTYELIVKRLGTPQEIASVWAEEGKVTPKRMQILFVVLNILIFLVGIGFTVAYNVFHFQWIEIIWAKITAVPSIIIMVYMIFWGLLGYEIGKEFGSGGLRILRRTFTYAVIPNLILMYLIVFKLIPHEWFQPLLNGPFIIACVLLTLVLYPISWIGYRWGRKDSL